MLDQTGLGPKAIKFRHLIERNEATEIMRMFDSSRWQAGKAVIKRPLQCFLGCNAGLAPFLKGSRC
jgi:hypothetical protein